MLRKLFLISVFLFGVLIYGETSEKIERMYLDMGIDSTSDAIYQACRGYVEEGVQLFDDIQSGIRVRGALTILTENTVTSQVRNLRKNYPLEEASIYLVAFFHGWKTVRVNFHSKIMDDIAPEEDLMRQKEYEEEIMTVAKQIRKYKTSPSFKEDIWRSFQNESKKDADWYKKQLTDARGALETDASDEEKEIKKKTEVEAFLSRAQKVDFPPLPKGEERTEEQAWDGHKWIMKEGEYNWSNVGALFDGYSWYAKDGDCVITTYISYEDSYSEYAPKGYIVFSKSVRGTDNVNISDDEYYLVPIENWKKIMKKLRKKMGYQD